MAEARAHVTFRIGARGKDWVETLMLETGADKSTVLRAALAVAKKHEPELKHLIKEQM